MTAPAAAVSLPAGRDDDERVARLWDAVDQKFLAVMGWNPDRQVVSFPQDHPLLGLRACRVSGCRSWARWRSRLCVGCEHRWAGTTGVSLAEFAAMPKLFNRCIGVVPCAVGGCQRPAVTTRIRLCTSHEYQQRRVCLPFEEFLAHPDVVPLASFGPCMAAACTRDREGRGPYCHQHAQRLQRARKIDPGLDVEAWRRTVTAAVQHKINSMGRLSESLRLQRADHGDVISALAREDITAFCNRMAFLAERGQIGGYTRVGVCRYARLVLNRCRTMGLTRPGQPLHGLPDDFTLLREDIPEEPEEDAAGKDLPRGSDAGADRPP